MKIRGELLFNPNVSFRHVGLLERIFCRIRRFGRSSHLIGGRGAEDHGLGAGEQIVETSPLFRRRGLPGHPRTLHCGGYCCLFMVGLVGTFIHCWECGVVKVEFGGLSLSWAFGCMVELRVGRFVGVSVILRIQVCSKNCSICANCGRCSYCCGLGGSAGVWDAWKEVVGGYELFE
eukprot:scaffold206529_cov114-Attheya_sp.AAC.1